jgi:hypothetical protein
MSKRTLSHLTLTVKDSRSLRTVVPHLIVKKLNLSTDSMLEWVDRNGEILVERF